ncbi:MAG TPA: folate family ECF transporter S component [Oscillospiraceae bacterium]|nr:folate family ECF transporter S component [Oscillospiraceae bacterium]HNW04980.1 folate family ECF transporter S component [Oscillospiraceae bacterium]HPW00444.1 folate family ECF transporter S component [Oscillospiraceae bacterium]
MKKYDVQAVVFTAVLAALDVVLTRFCSINTLSVKIGFGFVPAAVCGILFGPFWAAVCAGIGDLAGALLFPVGAYSPLFTASAALSGAIWGSFLHKREITKKEIATASLATLTLVTLCLNTLFIHFLYGVPFTQLFAVRVMEAIIMFAVQNTVLRLLFAAPGMKNLREKYGRFRSEGTAP